MIRRNKKICISCGNERYIYARGMCSFCYNKKQYGTFKKRNVSSPNILYVCAKKELRDDLINRDGWVCMFSGETLGKSASWHHGLGRVGELVYDKRYLLPSKWKYHSMWHSQPILKLKEEKWWNGFLERVKTYYPEYYPILLNQIDNREAK